MVKGLSNLSGTELLRDRRQRLAELVDFPVLLWSGRRSARNFPANTFPFRANSHFLYFAGLSLENVVIRLEGGKLDLFMDESSAADALWHGATPSRAEIAEQIGADRAFPLSALKSHTVDAATIAVQDAATRLQQSHLLNRMITPANQSQGIDLALAQAIVQLRLIHDAAAITEIRKAIAVSIEAHQAGMATLAKARVEAEVRAAMESVILARQMTCAYGSIVTVHGEVLHNEQYHHLLQPGDLLLADVGAETETGWASDLTRTSPVSGQFSPTQKDLYEVVLAAHDACIAKIHPGVEYRDIHLLAATVIAEGLVDLGILHGNPADLVVMDAHALFFSTWCGAFAGIRCPRYGRFWRLSWI